MIYPVDSVILSSFWTMGTDIYVQSFTFTSGTNFLWRRFMRFFLWIISGEFCSCFSTAFDKNFHLILNVRVSVYKYTHTWLKFTFPDSSFDVAKAGYANQLRTLYDCNNFGFSKSYLTYHKEATAPIYFVISRCLLNNY